MILIYTAFAMKSIVCLVTYKICFLPPYSLKRIILYKKCANITNKFEKINIVWKGPSCTRNVPTLQTNLIK